MNQISQIKKEEIGLKVKINIKIYIGLKLELYIFISSDTS